MIERGMRTALKKAGQPDIDLSPLFAYYNNRIMSGLPTTQDTGASIRASIDAARKFGLCRESYWTYANADGYLFVKPEPYAYEDGLNHQVLEAYTVPNTPDMIRQALAAGFGVCYGTTVHQNSFAMQSSGTVVMPQRSDPVAGAHALVLDTWDDALARYRFPNYWENWGDSDACGSVPYEHVSAYGFDLWAVRVVESDAPIELSHNALVTKRDNTMFGVDDVIRITLDGRELWHA
jgi:hypothetical protein